MKGHSINSKKNASEQIHVINEFILCFVVFKIKFKLKKYTQFKELIHNIIKILHI